MRATRRPLARVLAPLLALFATPLLAAEPTTLTGDYVCAYGCRATDAPPRIEIVGGAARCWNEIGGLFVGEFRAPNEIACFHKTGKADADGRTIHWSDGSIWIRH